MREIRSKFKTLLNSNSQDKIHFQITLLTKMNLTPLINVFKMLLTNTENLVKFKLLL